MKRKILVVPVLMLIMFQSCSDQITSDCETDKPLISEDNTTFSDIQEAIFTPNCVSCHGGSSPEANLNLSPGSAYADLVNVTASASSLKRVKPFDSENSYLIKRLSGSGGETIMPPGGKLEQALIDSVAAWIDRGALNN